jgi:tetratricopeptide (TPR) repeat protein
MLSRALSRVREVSTVLVVPVKRIALGTAALIASGLVVAACSSSASGTSSSSLETPAALLFNAGVTAEDQARYPQSINDLEAVLQLQPNNYLAAYDLGVADGGFGKTVAAATAYRRAISIRPSYRPALFNLALLYSNIEPAKALSVFRRLEAIDPGDPNVEFNFGLLLEHSGQVKAGETQLTTALKAEPLLKRSLPKGTILPPGV